MQEARVYVVRIYRQTGLRITGLVENVRTGETKAFASAQELSTFLAATAKRRRARPRGTTVEGGGENV
jgi:hypothetical protein